MQNSQSDIAATAFAQKNTQVLSLQFFKNIFHILLQLFVHVFFYSNKPIALLFIMKPIQDIKLNTFSHIFRFIFTFLGRLLQVGKVVGVSRSHFEKRHIELMKELHCHLNTEKGKVKLMPIQTLWNLHRNTAWWMPEWHITRAWMQKSPSHLIHPGGSEEDPHLLSILLQFPELLMA